MQAAPIESQCPVIMVPIHVAGVVTKAIRGYENRSPPVTPPRQPSPRRRGFLKGIRTQSRSRTEAASDSEKWVENRITFDTSTSQRLPIK